MIIFKLVTLIIIFKIDSIQCVPLSENKEVLTQPEQIHLSYGFIPSDMVVTWVTKARLDQSIVEYGLMSDGGRLEFVAEGNLTEFKDGGEEKRVIFIHRVYIHDLFPGGKYLYHVGSDLSGWSDLFTFTAMKKGSDWSPTLAFVGDMGNVNGQSISRLQKQAQEGTFDAVVHVGDFAYDFDTDNARFGDAFMNQVQSFAAYVPYMTCVGNHEQAYNFSNYKNRFSMPGGDGQGMFYSVNIGPVHLVAFSSEFYYFTNYGWLQIAEQYKWLEEDLRKANEPINRAKQPWIITMCHRPMYCSNSNDAEHCPNPENIIRVGLPYIHSYGMEDMLYKYGVDIHFQAHEHSYERLWPVYNLTVCNGSYDSPYRNPQAPVHIVTGSGGCQEGVTPFLKHPKPWSAFQSDDYGYTLLKVHNHSHITLNQISVDRDGQVIDSIIIEKQEHGYGTFNCHLQQTGQEREKMNEMRTKKNTTNNKKDSFNKNDNDNRDKKKNVDSNSVLKNSENDDPKNNNKLSYDFENEAIDGIDFKNLAIPIGESNLKFDRNDNVFRTGLVVKKRLKLKNYL